MDRQCIGLRSYRFYLLLIALALAFYMYTLVFSVRRIRVQLDTTSRPGVLGLLRNLPAMVALAAFSSVIVRLLACLLAYHVFLAAKNLFRGISCGIRMIYNVVSY